MLFAFYHSSYVKGKETRGYDPTRDVAWLVDEIHAWVYNNLWKRWATVKRKAGSGMSLDRLLSRYLAGYGANRAMCMRLASMIPAEMVSKGIEFWHEVDVTRLVDLFLAVRFPMVVVCQRAVTTAGLKTPQDVTHPRPGSEQN